MLGEESNLGASFSYNRLAKDKGEGTQTFNIMQNNVQKESSTVDYLSPGQSTAYSANAYYVGKIGGLNVDFNTARQRRKSQMSALIATIATICWHPNLSSVFHC